MLTNHIKATHDDDRSWCGKPLGNEPHFKSVDAAVLNGLHYTEVDACWECTETIINHLERGTCNTPESPNELIKDIFKIRNTLAEVFKKP